MVLAGLGGLVAAASRRRSSLGKLHLVFREVGGLRVSRIECLDRVMLANGQPRRLVQFGAFWLAWTPDEPKPGLLIDIGGWLLLSVTAMSGVSLLIFKIDREQRNFTTVDLVMVVGFLAPILLFMLAIGLLRPIQ